MIGRSFIFPSSLFFRKSSVFAIILKSNYRILPVDRFNKIVGGNWKDPGSRSSLEKDWKEIDFLSKEIFFMPENTKLLEARSELYNRVNLPLYGFADTLRCEARHVKENRGISRSLLFLRLDSLIELGDYYSALLILYSMAVCSPEFTYLVSSIEFLKDEQSIILLKETTGYINDCKKLLTDLGAMKHPNSVINSVYYEYLKLALRKYIEVMEVVEEGKCMPQQSLKSFGKEIIMDDTKKVVMRRLYQVESSLKTSIRDGPNSERSYDKILNYFNATAKGNHDVLIKPDDYGGFELIAGKDFSPGDFLLEEEPFVSFSNDSDGSRCSHCHRELKVHFQSVVHCKCGAGYCGTICKDTADQQYHSILCGTNYRDFEKNLISNAKSSSALFSCIYIRLVARAISEKKRHPKAFPDPVTPLDLPEIKLLHRTLDRPEGTMDRMTEPVPVNPFIVNHRLLNNAFSGLSSDWDQSLDMSTIVPIFNTILTNAISAPICSSSSSSSDDSEDRYNNYLIAVILKGSYFNHSCDPNVSWLGDKHESGRNIIFYATKFILKGEPMTICYLPDPSAMPFDIKQGYLKAVYGFNCRCRVCITQLANENKN